VAPPKHAASTAPIETSAPVDAVVAPPVVPVVEAPPPAIVPEVKAPAPRLAPKPRAATPATSAGAPLAPDAEAAALFDDASKARRQGDYARAIALHRDLLARFPRT